MKIEWDGKKLTKKHALFLFWKLWEWLAQKGTVYISLWPHWKENGGKVEKTKTDNFCCEYALQQNIPDNYCESDCILNSIWPNGCAFEPSPYLKWIWAKTLQTRKKYARIIAKGAKQEYIKLQKERR